MHVHAASCEHSCENAHLYRLDLAFAARIYVSSIDLEILPKTEKTGPFRKNKTPLRGIESFSNSTFYGAIVSNTQYSTSGDLIYSDNTNFYCIPKK